MATSLSADWVCPMCGMDKDAKATDCCDYCILSIFSGVHSPTLDYAFTKYTKVSDWVNDSTDYSEED